MHDGSLVTKVSLETTVLLRATYFVSMGNNIISRASPLEMEPVPRDHNSIFMLKPGDPEKLFYNQSVEYKWGLGNLC